MGEGWVWGLAAQTVMPDKLAFIRTGFAPAYEVKTVIFICIVYAVGLDFCAA